MDGECNAGCNLLFLISGVPQGSMLGPLLFVIYISDILDDINSDGLLYADDTMIFRTISFKNDAVLLQEDITNLESWSGVSCVNIKMI